jgi:hypothetical protein
MLTPFNCSNSVASPSKTVSCCFDTSQSSFGNAGSRFPSCMFGGKRAQTATRPQQPLVNGTYFRPLDLANCCNRAITLTTGLLV